jgi:uncharacterized protein YozE (UPF0346 family)
MDQLSFYEWLIRHRKRDTVVGDLANDVARDRDFPSHATTLQELRAHLSHRGACDKAEEALTRAWNSYRAYEKRQKSNTQI